MNKRTKNGAARATWRKLPKQWQQILYAAFNGNQPTLPRQGSMNTPSALNLPNTIDEISIFNSDMQPPATENSIQKDDIVLASYNIHKCVGIDKIFNPQRIIQVIAELQADIIALQEIDKRFGERYGLLNLAALEQETGLRPVPIQSVSPQGQGWHGNALFFRRGELCALEQIALPGVEPRGAIIADFAFNNGNLRIIAAHFGLLRRSRALQAQDILEKLAHKPPMPTVLLGDLNEWRLGKKSSLNALKPFFTPATDHSPSFPAHFPLLSLDRVFSTPHNLVTALTVHDSETARTASDHLPIKAVVRLPSIHKNSDIA